MSPSSDWFDEIVLGDPLRPASARNDRARPPRAEHAEEAASEQHSVTDGFDDLFVDFEEFDADRQAVVARARAAGGAAAAATGSPGAPGAAWSAGSARASGSPGTAGTSGAAGRAGAAGSAAACAWRHVSLS